jgi:hypothetical protein
MRGQAKLFDCMVKLKKNNFNKKIRRIRTKLKTIHHKLWMKDKIENQ